MLLAQTREGLARVRNIVHDLRVFSHVAIVPVAALLTFMKDWSSTVNIVLNEIRQKAELRRELAEVPPIVCNAGEINQVFLNLLMNAVQAIEQHGVITVRLGESGDGGVWFEVEDDGCGMSEEVRKHIFEPFIHDQAGRYRHRTRPLPGWKIVENHAGRITVDSMPGRGTKIRVCCAAGSGGK